MRTTAPPSIGKILRLGAGLAPQATPTEILPPGFLNPRVRNVETELPDAPKREAPAPPPPEETTAEPAAAVGEPEAAAAQA